MARGIAEKKVPHRGQPKSVIVSPWSSTVFTNIWSIFSVIFMMNSLNSRPKRRALLHQLKGVGGGGEV